ncbi:MAG: SPOR domain-containing protein [Gammaproteobacteria bacterium]|nr:SPOR domain-containing protein [Gammaproteobacteria bacterium]
MEAKKMQRIVGFLVLISIVIILFPLFVKKDVSTESAATEPAIAEPAVIEPAVPMATQTAQTPPVQQPPVTQAQPITHDNLSNPPTPSKPKALPTQAVNKKSSPAWSIQLGSFRQQKNAEQLIKKLQKAGYTTYTKKTTTRKGAVYTKVFVGPTKNLSSAHQISTQMNQKWHLLGIVVPYTEKT